MPYSVMVWLIGLKKKKNPERIKARNAALSWFSERGFLSKITRRELSLRRPTIGLSGNVLQIPLC